MKYMLFIFDDSETGRLSHDVTIHMGDGHSVLFFAFFDFLSYAGRPDDVCQGLGPVEEGANDEEAADSKDEGKEGDVDEVHRLTRAA